MSSKKEDFYDDETEKNLEDTDKQSNYESDDDMDNESEDGSDNESEHSCNYEEIVEGEDIPNIFEFDDNYDKEDIVRGDKRRSSNKMTRYEMVRIIGERVTQLKTLAKCFIKNKEDFDYETLAMEELRLKMIPFKVIRRLPNNVKEEWLIEELYIDHLFN